MEKGSFHNESGSSETEKVRETDELVRNIPLPNQMPRGMEFLDFATPSLKSTTLDHLIGQNEDLMARLSVALRKTNELEESQAILQKENLVFRGKFESLREQFLVLKEKDKRFTERTKELSSETQASREAQKQLEKVYAELYTQAKAFQRRVVALERYRVRITKAKIGIQEKAKRLPALEKEIARLESNLIESRKILTASHLQSVNNYENRLSENQEQFATLKGQIETLQAQAITLREKVGERDQIFDENVSLKNDLIYAQRELEQVCADNQEVMHRLSDEARGLRIEVKEHLIAHEAKAREAYSLKQQIPTLTEDNRLLREQVESLQVLWTGKQHELDQLGEKNSSLQKLNQSLSATLNQQRREIQTLTERNEQADFKTDQIVKKLLAEIQMLRGQMIER